MANKVTTAAEATSHITSGMTIGIGGWGARRKPLALIAELVARDDLSDLTVVAYGGPEVGILCRAGKVAKVISGFVTSTRSRSSPTTASPARPGRSRRPSGTRA